MKKTGTLFLIPVPLAPEVPEASFTPYLSETINQINEYIVENEKTARRFLKEAGLKTPQSSLILHDYSKHKRERTSMKPFFRGLLEGRDAGLMSEAGCPGVADPGSDVIAHAHSLGIKVSPLVGPSSIMLGLMASGFNGQSFAFHGYLPIDKEPRAKRLAQLEQEAVRNKQTQIFIETPFRNNRMLETILKTVSDRRMLCVAVNLTGKDERIISDTIQNWKTKTVDFHKMPAIFLLF